MADEGGNDGMETAGRALAQAIKKPPFRKRGVGGIYTYTCTYTYTYTHPKPPPICCYGERQWGAGVLRGCGAA